MKKSNNINLPIEEKATFEADSKKLNEWLYKKIKDLRKERIDYTGIWYYDSLLRLYSLYFSEMEKIYNYYKLYSEFANVQIYFDKRLNYLIDISKYATNNHFYFDKQKSYKNFLTKWNQYYKSII